MPTIVESLKKLKTSSFISIAKSRIEFYANFCENTIQAVEGERINLINGKIKKEITEWWLNHIKVKTVGVLCKVELFFRRRWNSISELTSMTTKLFLTIT